MKNSCKIKKELDIDILIQNKIKYEIHLGNVKSLRMHYNKKGALLISAPILIKESSIISFIEKNIKWILDKKMIIDEKLITYNDDSEHLFFGKTKKLKSNYSKTTRVDIIDDILIVSTNDSSKIRKLIINKRYELANQIFDEILYQAFSKMKSYLKEYPKLVIKESSSKWGCCYMNENKIMLNVALTQVPLYLIEYVVFHELTHFIVGNHSKKFHDVLSVFVPNERILAKELKKYTSIL